MTAFSLLRLSFCLSMQLGLLFTFPLTAQTLLTDSAFHRAAGLLTAEKYQAAMDPDNRLYNGPEYLLTGQGVKGHPFFLTDSLLLGSLHYDDALFSNIQLQYDLVLDAVVIDDYTHSAHILLIKEKIKEFTIGQHSFRFLDPGHRDADLLKAGFYEQLAAKADGSICLYARREKKITFPANSEEPANYAASDSYFIQREDRFYRIYDKRGLLQVLQDKKELLRKFIGDNHLDFKRDLERSLIKTTSYYAQLRP